MSDCRFISELDYSPATIEASLDSGLIEAWRTDPSGTRWYRVLGSRPEIHGVPGDDDDDA